MSTSIILKDEQYTSKKVHHETAGLFVVLCGFSHRINSEACSKKIVQPASLSIKGREIRTNVRGSKWIGPGAVPGEQSTYGSWKPLWRRSGTTDKNKHGTMRITELLLVFLLRFPSE